MRRRILRNMLVQVACTALVFTLLSAVVFIGISGQQVDRYLERNLKLISACISESDSPRAFLESLTESGVSERLTLIAPDGTVIFDNKIDPAQMDNHLDREEIQEARSGSLGAAQRYSPSLNMLTNYYAMRLNDGSFLRLSDTRSGVLEMMLGLSGWFLLALILVCLGAAALSLHITRRIVQPINAMDLDNPDENRVYPELQPLARRMTEQNLRIQEYIRTLKERKLEFEAITAQMEEGLILLNPKGEIIFINQSASALLKAQSAEGANILSLSNDRVFIEAFQTALGGRRTDALLMSDSSYHRLHINPVTDAGHTTGFMALIMDVTEQILAEQNRREFTANVSHELKTPLTSIVGYAEIMQNGLADVKDWKHLVNCIYDESARMMRLVEDILHLSRLESGRIHANPETLDLLDLSREIAARFLVSAEQHHVQLEVIGQPAQILADRHTAGELISNLIDNAIKYNRENGHVHIRVQQDGKRALLQVEDTGIGIPPEYHDRVFERFFRVDKSRSKATGGTGLGLSIVKHAATMLNGSLHLKSTPGVGSCISVHFPAAPK